MDTQSTASIAGHEEAPEVAGYCLIDELGSGGSGRVWSAVELSTGQRVAIKVFEIDPGCIAALSPARSRSAREELRRRFEREAFIAARFRGVPGLLQVHGLCKSDCGKPCLVMELLDARQGWEPLDQRLESCGVLPATEALRVGEQVAAALEALHAQGVVHRDIKPANLMVRGYGDSIEAKILDYGVALDSRLPRLSMAGETPATPQYLSPAALHGTVGPLMDVYALTVVLFEALTGRLPHEGVNVAQLLVAKMVMPALPVRCLRPDLPDIAAAVIDEALAELTANAEQLRLQLAWARRVLVGSVCAVDGAGGAGPRSGEGEVVHAAA
jgi:serine/threonine protein kinase